MGSEGTSIYLAEVSLQRRIFIFTPEKPVTWASGYQMPVYNDNRVYLGNYFNRSHIAAAFESLLADKKEPDIVAGTATAGIPHATSLADKLHLPLIYLRDKPKNHGLKNRIEGLKADTSLEGKEVLLIEDLVSTGGSSVNAVAAIREAGGTVNSCFSIFNYGFFGAEEVFAGKKPYDAQGNRLSTPCQLYSLLTFDTLFRAAIKGKYISTEQQREIEEWRADPFNWGDKHGFPRVVKKV